MASNNFPESILPVMPVSQPPPIDLRHMTSAGALTMPSKDQKTANRVSQHLRIGDHRLGSRSPTSIPSSPTSIHSSSSAIFERDIEPLLPPSPPNTREHHLKPHRIPRAKGTEQLEQSVPSVLDSAAEILATSDELDYVDNVAVLAPSAPLHDTMGRSSGFASPISLRSRSPSPISSRVPARNDIVLGLSNQSAHTTTIASPTSILGLHNLTPPSLSSGSIGTRAPLQTHLSGPAPPSPPNNAVNQNLPSIVTPASIQFSPPISPTDEEGLATTTNESPPRHIPSPHLSPSINTVPLKSPPSLVSSPISSPSSPPITLSHPPSPVHVAKKRLSFMSYSDLLSSTPASTQSLSSLTTYASSIDPPPHIPSVSGLNLVNAVQAAQQTNSATPSLHGFSLATLGGMTHPGRRDSIALLDNMGGEWEREGLGRGLEERLDALVLPSPVSAVPDLRPVVAPKA